jgi:hypothetical protein
MTMTTMSNGNRMDLIESKIDRGALATIGVSANKGMAIESAGQAMEFAKLMAVSGQAVPGHLRGNPGACLAIAMQGWEWGINPFAIANKTYVVNDRIGYESALYQAVLTRRAPIKGRLKCEYAGAGPTRTCRVYATLTDGDLVDYTSPQFGTINPKNSPLWKNDPDQQLLYFSIRSFARRHFADVMMGVYTADELRDAEPMRQPEAAGSRTQSVLAKVVDAKPITARPVSEGMAFVPDPDADQTVAAQDAHAAEAAGDPDQHGGDGPDVSGVDAEPPAGPRVGTWAETMESAVDAAATADMPESDMYARVNLWVLGAGAKGKEDKKTTPEQRAALVAAIAAGNLRADGKIGA